MQDTALIITRTWEVALYGSYEGGSARVSLGCRSVTLIGGRNAQGQRLALLAQVDGQPVAAEEAVSLLEWGQAEGRVTLLIEERTVPTIGKARAHKLHGLMARAGIPAGEHYGFAGAALDQTVYSLAALTEAQARAVWRFLTATHPAAA